MAAQNENPGRPFYGQYAVAEGGEALVGAGVEPGAPGYGLFADNSVITVYGTFVTYGVLTGKGMFTGTLQDGTAETEPSPLAPFALGHGGLMLKTRKRQPPAHPNNAPMMVSRRQGSAPSLHRGGPGASFLRRLTTAIVCAIMGA